MGFTTKASLEEHIRTQHLGVAYKIKPCRVWKAEDKEDEGQGQVRG